MKVIWRVTFMIKIRRKVRFVCLTPLKSAAGPIAKVQLPVRVPVGFHGVWVPDSAVS